MSEPNIVLVIHEDGGKEYCKFENGVIWGSFGYNAADGDIEKARKYLGGQNGFKSPFDELKERNAELEKALEICATWCSDKESASTGFSGGAGYYVSRSIELAKLKTKQANHEI